MTPLLTLVNTHHPYDIYGFDVIHVVAFSSDGGTYCIVEHGGEKFVQSFTAGDTALILEGDSDGHRYYEPAEPKLNLPSVDLLKSRRPAPKPKSKETSTKGSPRKRKARRVR
jgi:hypothetical protein